MSKTIWACTLLGEPRTKKNSQQIFKTRSGRPFVAPSKSFSLYQEKCLWQIKAPRNPISEAVNVRCVYYMPTRRRVDLGNLQSSTLDILVKAGVLLDDNRDVVACMDGSRVFYDKENPRVEIVITKVEGYTQWGKR